MPEFSNKIRETSIMNNLSSSLEDYLEVMIELHKSDSRIRITDISNKLNVEKTSVYSAIKKLQNLNLVTHERCGDVQFTQKGKETEILLLKGRENE